MAYDVDIQPAVVDYISALALPLSAREGILLGIAEELSQRADDFLEQHPLGHESLHFRYDYIYPTYETMFALEFIIDASHREMGVVVVEFVDCITSPMSDLES